MFLCFKGPLCQFYTDRQNQTSNLNLPLGGYRIYNYNMHEYVLTLQKLWSTYDKICCLCRFCHRLKSTDLHTLGYTPWWRLWTETPFRAELVLSMSTLSAKGIWCIDWPDPPLMLIQQNMYGTYLKTNKCSASSTTNEGWHRRRALLLLFTNGFFCNQKTDSQLY